jgi:uncharacterized DUF497 family protein
LRGAGGRAGGIVDCNEAPDRSHAKDARQLGNIKRHKVTFEAAIGVFDDPFARDEVDDSEDYGEERSNILGMVAGRLLVVAYTLRGGTTRIISARPAEPHERRRYHEAKR